ncbi:hypothetical protein PsorP6_010971 [Peronosclerospora sorghi]|uniref:Uncharacterized protein n=1 Tax=Peronosclerospora sorghi TaxID=230839 RepID=A0ACC0VV49_9STRA|nr:hypothetical protein PsorP6_010971 [Peronosclerospora sorghi]
MSHMSHATSGQCHTATKTRIEAVMLWLIWHFATKLTSVRRKPEKGNVSSQRLRAPSLLPHTPWHRSRRVGDDKANHVLVVWKCAVIRTRGVPDFNTKSFGYCLECRTVHTDPVGVDSFPSDSLLELLNGLAIKVPVPRSLPHHEARK